jgi:predicted 3-demethylubiquinone-9 3-methyltransferase (glyoxalase superfamily)
MALATQRIMPCLWFDTEAEDAANFYCSVFKNSRITEISRYGKEGFEQHGKVPGSVIVVAFEIEGQKFVALNGGPQFKLSEAVSFQIHCESQKEVDYFWDKLTDGGEEGPCGWLKDKYGVSWQVIPAALPELLGNPDPERSQAVMRALLTMKKIEIEELERAASG